MKKNPSYWSRMTQFSIAERIILLLYSFFSSIINKLPRRLIRSYEVFRKMNSLHIDITKKGTFNLITGIPSYEKIRIRMKRSSSDPLVIQQIFLDEEYKELVRIIEEDKAGISTILDAGANIGCSVLFLKHYFPNAEVLALEPNPEVYERLIQNIGLNELTGVKSEQIGLWNKNDRLSAKKNFRDGEDWSFSLSNEGNDHAQYNVKDIPTLLNQCNWESIDLLKIDIEGGEKELFSSKSEVEDWLKKVKYLAIEIHDEMNCRKQILDILKACDFSIKETQEGLTICKNRLLT